MSIKKELEEAGFHTFEHADKKFNELKEQFIEMSQLKSDFAIEKFTVKKEGNFLAHNFHMLMRQYSLALSEMRRMLIEKEELQRKIEEYTEKLDKEDKVMITTNEGTVEKYTDLYIKELINRLDLLELNIVNKIMSVNKYEQVRKKIIELNGGVPTNEQYQKEEPHYWKWFLQKKALHQASERQSGIQEGVWMNMHYLEEPAVVNPEFQVEVKKNGKLDFNEIKKEVETRLQSNVPDDNPMLE